MFTIEVEFKSRKWLKQNNIEEFIKKTSKEIFNLLPLSKFKKIHFSLSISLSSNLQIKNINQVYRGKNQPTDVLSFGNFDEINLRKFGLKNSLKNQKFFFLGDLIFGLEYIENHCKANKIDFNAHLTHLILHGLLHIIGYDHEIGEKDAKIMEALEIKILKKLKINNPYL